MVSCMLGFVVAHSFKLRVYKKLSWTQSNVCFYKGQLEFLYCVGNNIFIMHFQVLSFRSNYSSDIKI